MPRPTPKELLDALDDTERALSPMIGRWSNGIPGHVRAELIRVR